MKSLSHTLADYEDKLRVKTEAIEKAHKVIQAMSEELGEGNKVVTRLEQERDRLRIECRQAGKQIKQVGKLVQEEYERERAISAERVI